MSYTNFQVGEKFPLPIKAQGEGGIFQYDINGAMFILKLAKTDIIAIEAFRTGKLSLSLFTKNNILFFLYKIEGIFNNWGDCPYAVKFLESDKQPDPEKAQEKVLNLYLVDSNLDVLLAMRTIQLSDEFWQALQANVKAQLQAPFSSSDYVANVQKIWSKYSSDDMAKNSFALEEVALEIPVKPAQLH